MDISELLQMCVDRNASDIHLTVGRPPTLRIDGLLEHLDYEPLTPDATEDLMKSITSEEYQQKIQEVGGIDFGFAFSRLVHSGYAFSGNTARSDGVDANAFFSHFQGEIFGKAPNPVFGGVITGQANHAGMQSVN